MVNQINDIVKFPTYNHVNFGIQINHIHKGKIIIPIMPKLTKKIRHALRGQLRSMSRNATFKAYHHMDKYLAENVAKYSALTHAKSKATIGKHNSETSIVNGNIANQRAKVTTKKNSRPKKR